MTQKIVLQNVRVHNLKSVSLQLEQNQLICFTGISGSGKSSLAFDTIYVEGQRRYVESLSGHVRRYLGDMPKPDLDQATGLTPTISIEQKTAGKNPRSTVGTITEIYDYMRLLWARCSTAYCPVSGEAVRARSTEEIIESVLQKKPKTRLVIMAPHARNKKGEFKDDLELIAKKGFMRVRIDDTFLEVSEPISLDKGVAHNLDIVIDRVVVDETNRSRIIESIQMALELGSGSCIIFDPDTKAEEFLSQNGYSQKSGLSYPPLDPQDFSFNSPLGSCPECQGMGTTHTFNLDAIIDPKKSIMQDCCSIASSYSTVRYGNIYDNLANLYNFSLNTPWEKLSPAAKQVFLYGTEKKWTRMYFVHPETGATWHDTVQWRGVLHDAYSRYQEAKSDTYKRRMERLMHKAVCPSCQGERLKPYPRHALFISKRIGEVCRMTIDESLAFFKSVKLTGVQEAIGKEIVKEIIERLSFLHDVGLEYIQIDRTAPTLSGGESQRVRLASQIGSGLVGVTYILDEPSIGLHMKDNAKLIQSLSALRDKGNTVIVVEHDEETIRAADTIVDFGPKAGHEGGNIIFQGPVDKLLKNKKSLTANYLSKRLEIVPPKKRRTSTGTLTLQGASHNNLKNVTLHLPLGCFVAVTGVSGSGKSSLFLETLYPALHNALLGSDLMVGAFSALSGIEAIEKVIEIDQSPIGRTPRSNPATYIKLFDHIRQLFAHLPASRAKGFTPGRFSFNVSSGSCSVCHGMGQLRVDMDFLEDAWVDCPTCGGMRFDAETLSIRYKGKNIKDVLDMDVDEAKEHFANIPAIQTKLDMLERVGLHYMKLGQASTTISGGEAQRIKLVKELSRSQTGKTIYILDEPTTGLHFHDMNHLIEVLQALVDKGNSVVVIEHNIDLIKCADYIIEMGPASGDAGGKIIATGTPVEIEQTTCATAEALKHHYSLPHTHAKKKKVLTPELTVIKAEQNNLKKCSAVIPRAKMTVCTGPSGSGKSSFAFETVYAEGQRRYVESLSPYVRQFVKQMPKPKVEEILGLSPAIAIEQRLHATNPRSTVGTMTEIYDYLRIVYARIGIPHDPKSGHRIQAISKELVVDRILSFAPTDKIHIMAPVEMKRGISFEEVKERLIKQGFVRIRLNKSFYELTDPIPYDPKRKNVLHLVVDRVHPDPSEKGRLFEAVSVAANLGKQKLAVLQNDTEHFFNLAFAVIETGESYPEITPQTFAFNTVQGMCPDCIGLGYSYGIDIARLPFILKMTSYELMELLWGYSAPFVLLKKFFQANEIDPHLKIGSLSPKQLSLLLQGSTAPCTYDGVKFYWRGINDALALIAKGQDMPFPEEWQDALKENVCPTCVGTRLNALARHVTISGVSIDKLCDEPIDKAKAFVEKMQAQDKVLQEVLDEIRMRLTFLEDIGLQYLTLSRSAGTLSGGEAGRVRLARQIGSGLTSVLYVLDEPTIGLHPQDSIRLTKSLHALQKLGNTLLVVEHDPQLIQEADHIVEFGPKSGKSGGEIVASGTPQELIKNPASLTGKYLKTQKAAKKTERKKKSTGALVVEHAKLHNLKSISCEFPLATFTCLTGVSGSGKSTLLDGVIREGIQEGLQKKKDVEKTAHYTLSGISAFSKLIVLDQKPIGHTVRSDVATFTDVFTPMRHFFALLPEAKAKGLLPKHFSAYHRKGMCTHCWGLGYKRVEMYFMPAVKIACPKCHGLRLNPLSLSITYKGKNMGELLQLSVDEVRALFEHHPKVIRLLDVLARVGLGYLHLGQEMQTLSSGETQRMKLARELSKYVAGKALYLFDEPTTGLHPQEIETVIQIIDELVARGHTVIAIEHNLDFIRSAEHIIDLGPGAGHDGGKVVATGPVASIAKSKKSITGKFL